ncbi:hypothetical protein ACH4LN_25510 [Streptomyces albus]|uniref:Uncharacterized protein n=1 Tax=Streptomyces albus TaxID=1888 RepID=A0A6C1BWE7_9ACTN|nr:MULTISPECIES: hypothetical protein [Streptomyces]KPC65731.1 hypothetical protein ADL27_59705 [Streptomyces sp. NRRL F-6602]EPD96747.1 hypothetical protein HMPREF1486_00606 [Streptomyces sp. HPH0547]MDI6412116.1 hypothetical protein [Streptomyces albus]QID35088.1 hypothetical protein G3260_000993 [Streptomyces albus]TGG76358.1 hypothetical protein D8771_30685 [Streptomyces albus]
MENFYRGPAILLTGAAEVPVDAALYTETTGPGTAWSGTIRPEGSQPLWVELEGDSARLRLADGRVGRITILGSGFGTVQVNGEGPLPANPA